MENENNTNKNSNSTMIWIVIGILVVAAIVVVLVTTGSQTSPRPEPEIINDNLSEVTDPTQTDQNIIGDLPEETMTDEGYRLFEGTNLIRNGIVVNDDGEPVNNADRAGRDNAPMRTGIINHEDLPSEFRRLFITRDEGFSPEVFRVQAGQVVALALVSNDDLTHSIVFDDPSLRAIVLNVGPEQTRAMVFNAPNEPGEYTFKSGVPRRDNAGVMIVE